MQVSFIIPHKGREELLRQTVDSILALDFPNGDFEIIIVSQNVSLTFDQLNEAHKNKITVIHRPTSDTISALRNTGARTSDANYLAFLDADVALSSNWLHVMIDEINQEERSLISAVQYCEADAPPTEKIRTAMCQLAQDKYVEYADGHNLFLAKSTFEKVGGFPEHLLTCEDIYFTGQVRKLGKLLITSKAHHIHLGEDKTYKQLFHKEIWRGQSNLQSLKGRTIPLRELPSFLVPIWLIFAFIFTLLAIPLQKSYLFAFSLLMLLLPIILYATRLNQHATESIDFTDALKFYATYLPARAVGTIVGIYKAIKNKTDN